MTQNYTFINLRLCCIRTHLYKNNYQKWTFIMVLERKSLIIIKTSRYVGRYILCIVSTISHFEFLAFVSKCIPFALEFRNVSNFSPTLSLDPWCFPILISDTEVKHRHAHKCKRAYISYIEYNAHYI